MFVSSKTTFTERIALDGRVMFNQIICFPWDLVKLTGKISHHNNLWTL